MIRCGLCHMSIHNKGPPSRVISCSLLTLTLKEVTLVTYHVCIVLSPQKNCSMTQHHSDEHVLGGPTSRGWNPASRTYLLDA